MFKRLAFTALLAASAASPAAAAVTIDFNDLRPTNGRTFVYGPLETQGFLLESSVCPISSTVRLPTCFVTPANTINNIDRVGAALVNQGGGATISLEQINGGVFTLESIVLASNINNSSGLGSATQDAFFTFNLADGTVLTETRTISSTGVANRNTLTFDLGPLTSFSFRPTRATSGFLQFDDIVVTPAVAAIPEPATWAMMIGGFGLVGGALRRRRAGAAFA